jgi:raffinose/stachyose/melibiose transport system substrate-binding protein
LVIYNADPTDAAYYNQIDATFEKANHVSINLVSYPSDSFMQNYDAAIAGHTKINVLLANGQNIAFMQEHGQLVPLTNLVPASVFRPSMLTPFYHDNQLWAYPGGSLATSGVIYNMSLLAKYHLTPPTTFAQVIADGKILGPHGYNVLDAEGGTIYQLVVWYMQTLEQATKGKEESVATSTTTTGKPAFTSSAYINAMNAIYELAKAPGVFEPGVGGVTETSAIALFDSGKAAAFYAGSWDLQPAVEGASFPIGTGQFPNFVPGAPSGAAGGQPLGALGQEAVRFLISAIESPGSPRRELRLLPELIVRESSVQVGRRGRAEARDGRSSERKPRQGRPSPVPRGKKAAEMRVAPG